MGRKEVIILNLMNLFNFWIEFKLGVDCYISMVLFLFVCKVWVILISGDM